MRTTLYSIPVALAAALSFGAVMAQTGSSSSSGARSAPATQAGTGTRNSETRKDDQLARGDRRIMQKAAESGVFEVQAGQLAATKANDPAVKSFASMLVDQHTAANNELTQLANSKKVELPVAPGWLKRRTIADLGKRSGADFDQHFVREIGIKDHQDDIKTMEKASRDAKDPQLKTWIDKTLPTLREHLAQAQKLPQASGDAAAMGNKGANPMKKSAS
jgi:putative membrane protein